MRNSPLLAPGIAAALAAALLFGATTPFAKLLVGDVGPLLLAGLLYLGSGTGLLAWWSLRRSRDPVTRAEAPLARADLPWLAGAITAGGILGPALLMLGLAHSGAARTSLLLNLEAVFTAALAWFVFHENFDRRIVLGMASIVCGSALLAWTPDAGSATPWTFAIVGACLAWAIDNNLTRRVSAGNPVLIAGLKGLVAGTVNTGLALVLGDRLPSASIVFSAGVIGLLGYGISLVLFVLALRQLGSARTGAYFSTAPFIGVVVSMLLLRELPGFGFWVAAALMSAGVWLHLTERHQHVHVHEPLDHTHSHVHDIHHQHTHDFPWKGNEPHTHLHHHEPLLHNHPHYPDIHHRHRH